MEGGFCRHLGVEVLCCLTKAGHRILLPLNQKSDDGMPWERLGFGVCLSVQKIWRPKASCNDKVRTTEQRVEGR